MAKRILALRMSYDERERLKDFARARGDAGDIQSLVATLIMISHWMRQSVGVGFHEYACQWVEAQREHAGSSQSTPAMADEWPFSGEHHIYPRCTTYFRRKLNPDERW